MKENILISLIIPIHNSEKTIERCLSSVLNQTYTNYEVIIIDDGSVDNSYEIINRYSKRDNRIKYFFQKNGGPGSARNNGIKKSSGEFICFIDSDDYIKKDFLEKIYCSSLRYNSDICIGRRIHKFIDKSVITPEFSDKCVDYIVLINMILNKEVAVLVTGNLYKSKHIKANKIYFKEDRYSEDMLFNFELCMKNPKVSFCNNDGYILVDTESSLCHTFSYKFIYTLDSLLYIKKLMIDSGIYDELKENYVNFYLEMSRYLVDYGIRTDNYAFSYEVIEKMQENFREIYIPKTLDIKNKILMNLLKYSPRLYVRFRVLIKCMKK